MVFDVKEYRKEYREKNRKRINAYFREYYKKNKLKHKLQVKKWKEQNPIKYQAYIDKRKTPEAREKMRIYLREWRRKSKKLKHSAPRPSLSNLNV